MTTGHKVVDNRRSFQPISSSAPGWTVVPLGPPVLVGGYFEKIWSGLDRDPIPQEYVTHYFWNNGKRYKTRHHTKPPKRARRDDDHPYSAAITSRSDTTVISYGENIYTGESEYQNHQRFVDLYGDGYTVDPSVGWSSSDSYKLFDKLRTKVSGSTFNLGVFASEGKDALRLISNSCISLASAVFQFKRGNLLGAYRSLRLPKPKGSPSTFKPAKDFGKEVSDRWLEMQYGWMPLLQDIEAGAHAAAKILGEPFVQTYRVRRTVDRKLLPVSSNLRGTGRAYESRTLIARISEVDLPGLYGLTDIKSVIWEQTPWSVVSDWVLPVADWLRARALNETVHGVFVTSSKRADVFLVQSIVTDSQYHHQNIQGAQLVRAVQTWRSVATNLDVPPPTVNPMIKAASVGHCLNALALLSSSILK